MTQRGDGLLTDRQREYLHSDESVGNMPRALRRQIRDRVQGALEDFKLLFHEMEHRDIVQLKTNESNEFDQEFQDKYVDSVAFLSRIAFANSVSLPPLFEEAIRKSYNKEHGEFSDVSIQINTKPIDDIDAYDFSHNAPGIPLTRPEGGEQSPYDDSPSGELTSDTDPSLIETFIRSHPDALGHDISLVDEELPSTGEYANPDIIGRDENEQLVLIVIEQFNEDSTPDSVETTVEKLQEMVSEYGGENHATGMLITLLAPDSSVEIVDRYDAIEHLAFEDIIKSSQ